MCDQFIFVKFLKEKVPIVIPHSLMGAESRKERILKKCQREPELRHHKVQDQGGEEGGNAGGLGGLGAVLKLVFFQVTNSLILIVLE